MITLDFLRAKSQLRIWKLAEFNQVVENVTLEMRSDVLHVPILGSLHLRLEIRFNLRTPLFNRTKLKENKSP